VKEPNTFEEYYKYYLTLHSHPACKFLHSIGQVATLAYIGLCFVFNYWWGLLAAPFVVYPFAWSGHYFFEKNKPAAWSNPIWAKLSDWVMFRDIITGRIKL
tara:strand:+ start:183 stop:485 length:303 start_codon:yes stop_codon:yes gene_type:complete